MEEVFRDTLLRGLRDRKKSQFTLRNEVEKILSNLEGNYRYDCIMAKFETKDKTTLLMNSIQYALYYKSYRVLKVLLTKVTDLRAYLGNYELLEQAIISEDDEQIGVILEYYQNEAVPILPASMSKSAKDRLYDGSWNQKTIKAFYPYLDSFLIPKGKNKAKMIATVCYNRFLSQPKGHIKRHGATAEAERITKGLRAGGFTVKGPLIDWSFDELLGYLKNIVHEIKDVLCAVCFYHVTRRPRSSL